MSADNPILDSWLQELHRGVRRHNLVLLVLGYVHDPIRDLVLNSFEQCIDVRDYVGNSVKSETGRVCLTNLEELTVPGVGASYLPRLRDRIVQDLDSGTNVVLLSRHSRIRFPDVPGSSVLEDAKLMVGPLYCENETKEDPPSALPVYSAAVDKDVYSIFSCALSELGLEVAASLDHALFEAMQAPDDALGTLSPRELEALVCAGLIAVGDGTYRWTVPKRMMEFRQALADTLARSTEVQEVLPEVFQVLWGLERQVRAAMRRRAVAAWGDKWRRQALNGDLVDKVLERATSDAYVAAKSLAEIRDPFEWLTFGELLALRDQRIEYGQLGLEKPVWRQFAIQILPIRNRLSHMRLLRPGDLTIVRQWSMVMSRKLQD